MALVNDVKREINAKIVYVGPRGCGKTAALRYIYTKLKPEYRSELKQSPLGEHQLVFFDFSYPQSSRADGYSVRFHLYTIQVGDGSPPPWKMLLKGADGLVFMADSAAETLEDTIASSAQLYELLAHYRIRISDLPFSIQCTRRDLPDALPLERIAEETFPELSGAVMPVSVASGEGLLEGLQRVVRGVLQNLGQLSAGSEGAADEELTVEDKPAEVRVVPSAEVAIPGGLTVVSAGQPQQLEPGVLSVPLRLLDANGTCQAEFSLSISITS
jgi:signal recognition particle receptor subunit beta